MKKATFNSKKQTPNKNISTQNHNTKSGKNISNIIWPAEKNKEIDYQSLGELTTQTYHNSLAIFRELILESELKLISLKEKSQFLQAKNELLEKEVKEYKTIYQEWLAEKKELTVAMKRAVQKAENTQKTKSFRLGYALIFGFKSWQGFKNLLNTLFTLHRERKPIKLTLNPEETTLNLPTTKELKWESQKPILHWTEQNSHGYLTDFTPISLSGDTQEDILTLDKTGVKTTIDCQNIKQLLIKVNTFSKEKPKEVKQSLLTMVFYDKKGSTIQPPLQLPFSKALNKHYFYLNSSEQKDDYIFLLIPNNVSMVELGIVLWDAKSKIYYRNNLEVATFSEGISVIIPTYKGEKTILKCLESLAKQSLPLSNFEVLLVINGEQDNTPLLIEQFKQTYPQLNLKVFEQEEGNVSKARNLAIKKAERSWITFIDDDDFVPENYLNSLYQYSIFNTISVTGIEDIIAGEFTRSSIMNQLDNAAKKKELNYFDVTSTMTMNACKLAPSYMVKNTKYDWRLRSGEDVVYWSKLINRFNPKIALVKSYAEDSYKRLVRENSISRKKESYDFNVLQRLEVIKQLIDELSYSNYQDTKRFIQSKIDAQSGFIKRYLTKHKQDYIQYKKDLAELNLHNKFISDINSLFSDTLVISYCFAPYIDTSGIVMSKRIRAMDKPVDIITNSMNKVRKSDKNLLKISEYYLGKHIELNTPQAFSNWSAISKFADSALDAAHSMMKQRTIYKNLYSRAMWPASHIAAALIKMKYPTMKWSAEFSDPILMDVSAKERYEEIATDWLEKYGFIKNNKQYSEKQNLFYWCERLPYLYADELIFTNKNQLDYMLSYADKELHNTIIQKAVILPQPIPSREFYRLSDIKLEKNEDQFHLAYFGSFYINRGFQPFVDAWDKLPEKYKKYIKLHIYTEQEANLIINQFPENLKSQVVIQKYVEYFDFLTLSDQYDGLIVMDTQTKKLKMNNPYLPSKISDYLGSITPTLALVEDGSPMSQINNKRLLIADINNINDICNAIIKLLTLGA